MDGDGEGAKLSKVQRQARRRIARLARKPDGEPLDADDWEAYFRFFAQPSTRAAKWALRSLPSSPRCGYCGAPFAGFGAALVRPLGYRPSRKNPNLCASCVEMSPPGGATMEIGVLFADVRGFTTMSEREGSTAATNLLRRFYAHAEEVFFPEALIDKLIGDEVMALYVPMMIERSEGQPTDETRRSIAKMMLGHARELLERSGYGTPDGPSLELGVGMDFGEAFLGHVGRGAVHDFTAVGDVVNTASRLQHQATAGEVVLSDRLAKYLPHLPGTAENLTLKGKDEPLPARRVQWFAARPSS
ncbi:MAG TPA: adenylate/guanylate cyclase domain-containing protein [Jatrophihabitantaceae bacterium]|nr:adenylate/guanylate cyclase domain-containing protein [Jatrophihabitantaceae bacterium]